MPEFLGKRIGFLTLQTRNRFTWIKGRFARQVVFRSVEHLAMVLHVLRSRDAEMFFIFEHKVDYSLPLYLALLLKRKPVFFFVHEMQQCATLTRRSRMALDMCRAFVRLGEFYPVFIALGDAGLEPRSRFSSGKTLTIPHPHHLADQPLPVRPVRARGARLRVGVIETSRKEKPVHHLFNLLQKFQEPLDFELLVGASLAKEPGPSWLNASGVKVYDTTTEAQFCHYLRGLDIFVVDFLKAEYLFRPSGAIVDAGMNGCYVICPDFLVFRAQIDIPVSIGSTFSSLDELPQVLEKSIRRVQTEAIDFETWRNHHRFESTARRFEAFLKQRDLDRA